MPMSNYQKKRIEREKKKARALYKEGFSTREIGEMMNPKKSHNWVWMAVAGMDNEKLSKKLSTGLRKLGKIGT